MISGFTFVHNGLSGGYPFVEAIHAVMPYVDEVVAVDMQSTDGTKEILEGMCHKVLISEWNGRDTTNNAFLKHTECRGDIIVFFEADEVYDESLLKQLQWHFVKGENSLAVWRVQIEQNFQRVREYPVPVHRVFPKGGGTYHIHPTIWPEYMRSKIVTIPQKHGYLWDCANCFKYNWLRRKQTQSEIWGPPRHLIVADHFTKPNEVSEQEEMDRLTEPHWEWTETPLNIPAILKPLVGKTKYEVEWDYR